jgi:hypothetical protein
VAEQVGRNQKKKITTWKELTSNENCEMEMMTVMDLTQRTTSRRCRTKWKLDARKPPEDKENEENKQENRIEAATPRTPGRKKSRSTKLGILKMTTPKKVKTASPAPRMSGRKESPRNRTLKRLTQQNLLPMKPRMILCQQTAEDSRRNFTSLLSKWEDFSNSVLTSALQTKPRLNFETDGQSQEVLQNNFEKYGQAPDLPLDAKVGNVGVLQSRTNRKPPDRNLENLRK